MDLSNLSMDLPPTKSVNQTSVDDLSKDLTTEFKNAAKSVAKLYNSTSSGSTPSASQKAEFANAARSVTALYRLTHNATSLLKYNGYLNCLDDLLEVIADDGDVENWALTKRAEITNLHNVSSSDSEKQSTAEAIEKSAEKNASNVSATPDFQFPLDFQFNFDHDIRPKHPIVPGYSPLSVQHKQHYRPTTRKTELYKDSVSSPSKSSSSEDDLDDQVVLKKLKHDQGKKKWKKTMSDHNSPN